MRLSGEGVTPFRESEMLGNEKSAGHGEEFLQNTSQFLWFPGVTQTQPSRITMMKTKLALLTVLVAALFGGGCSSLDKGLVAYYPFNEGEGATVADQSGNGHTGVLEGAKWVDGVSGHALEFSKNRVSLGSYGGYSDKVSITGWFKTVSQSSSRGRGAQGWMHILAGPRHKDVIFGLGDNNRPGWGIQSNPNFILYSNNPVIDAKWHFLVGTYDGNTQKIFVDGGLEKSKKSSGIFKPGLKTIGSRSESDRRSESDTNPLWTGFFIGSIDNVRIYNRALSDKEVKALYDLEKPKGK